MMTQKHALHAGELRLQKLRHTPSELADVIPNYIRGDMPQQHAEFFPGLAYLPLGALDNQGRPWASLLVTKSGDDPSVGITVSGHNQTDVVAETNPHDPFVRALGDEQAPHSSNKRLFAGVGIDYTNRRRNKLAGQIEAVSLAGTRKIHLRLLTDQHLGNCPKYITVRTLQHEARDAELVFDSPDAVTAPLPTDAKTCINRASTTYLATKHIVSEEGTASSQCDMGFNHRGGAPGFVRLYEETEGDTVTTYLVMPDHSGNRFYQSLGNIETDRQVGMIFPDFTSGDILYVTGDAENLHDEDAQAIMPRVGLLTRIKLTGAVFVKSGLNLRLTSDEHFSPYNPPVKYLEGELADMGHATVPAASATPISARMISAQAESDSVSTFTFGLSSPIEQSGPGGFGVFDFSALLDTGYRHMDDVNPQMVNEDYIRTWTISNAPAFDTKRNTYGATNEIAITIKRKPGGLISNFLHDNAEKLIEQKLPVAFKGTGAGFGCFVKDTPYAPPRVPAKMLWAAAGVGITPFMAMWDGLIKLADAGFDVSSDIVLLFSGRDDDIKLLKRFLMDQDALPGNLTYRVLAFQSGEEHRPAAQSARHDLRTEYPHAPLTIQTRRIQIEDLKTVEDLTEREVFLCGPDKLTRWYEDGLVALGVDPSKLHQETFSF